MCTHCAHRTSPFVYTKQESAHIVYTSEGGQVMRSRDWSRRNRGSGQGVSIPWGGAVGQRPKLPRCPNRC
eukprot:3599630-Prymnesium_polylepis.1